MLFTPGQKLGGKEPCQQVHGHAAVDHGEQLVVQIDQLLHRVEVWGHGLLQFLILLVEHIGQSAQ